MRPTRDAAVPATDPFSEAPPAERLKGHVAMFISMVAHISGFVLYKDVSATLPVTQMVATQLVIGMALLWLFVLATRQPLRLQGPLWRIGLLGSLAPASMLLIMGYGTRFTSASNATIIFGLAPVILPVLAWLILKERLRISVIVGALIAFAGFFLIVSRRASLGAGDLYGDMIVLLAVACACSTQMAGRRVNQYFSNPVTVTTYQVTVSALIATCVMLIVEPVGDLAFALDRGTWLKLGYLGLVSIVVNYLTYNFALRRLPVAQR